MPPFSIFGLINCLALPQTLLIQTTQSIYTSSQATWLENHHYVHVAKADEIEGYVVDYGNRRSLTKTIKQPQCVVIVVNLCARARIAADLCRLVSLPQILDCVWEWKTKNRRESQRKNIKKSYVFILALAMNKNSITVLRYVVFIVKNLFLLVWELAWCGVWTWSIIVHSVSS